MRLDAKLPSMATTARAPGSVTTVFVPQGEDGSLAVSFATADGVTATLEEAEETAVLLDGEPTSVEPVADVLDRLDATATVHLKTAVPIGRGFGVSGADRTEFVTDRARTSLTRRLTFRNTRAWLDATRHRLRAVLVEYG